MYPTMRLRRLREHPKLRALVCETELSKNDFILPLFIKNEEGEKKAITSMPGHFQIPLSCLNQELDEIVALGISAIILFGIPPEKDAIGSNSFCDHGIIQKAIRQIKKHAPDLLVISDTCLCEYTDHGHCGVMDGSHLNNDKTLDLLVKQAVSHAQAGTDVIAPSGMIDGMVAHIRQGLDAAGFKHIPILSYSVKYSSSMYGPFRAAAEGAPQFGDRSTYQMDPANAKEALRESALDVAEGADMLMVKPAHAYLDVIYRVKQAHPQIPLCAYHTSGEFSMIKAASEKGWMDEKKAFHEVLTGIKRAGADFIITYYAKEYVKNFF